MLFKGHLGFKQYIPNKRSRFGLKTFELASTRGYIMDLILYHGQGSIDQDQYGVQAQAVVMQLLRPYYYKGHTLYLDNWYSSIPLADNLFKKKVSITGMLRSNRKGFPAPIKKTKLEKGEFLYNFLKIFSKFPYNFPKIFVIDLLKISTKYSQKFCNFSTNFSLNLYNVPYTSFHINFSKFWRNFCTIFSKFLQNFNCI